MRSYVAVRGKFSRWGSLPEVIEIAVSASLRGQGPVRILTGRAGERWMRLVAEVDAGTLQWVRSRLIQSRPKDVVRHARFP